MNQAQDSVFSVSRHTSDGGILTISVSLAIAILCTKYAFLTLRNSSQLMKFHMMPSFRILFRSCMDEDDSS